MAPKEEFIDKFRGKVIEILRLDIADSNEFTFHKGGRYGTCMFKSATNKFGVCGCNRPLKLKVVGNTFAKTCFYKRCHRPQPIFTLNDSCVAPIEPVMSTTGADTLSVKDALVTPTPFDNEVEMKGLREGGYFLIDALHTLFVEKHSFINIVWTGYTWYVFYPENHRWVLDELVVYQWVRSAFLELYSSYIDVKGRQCPQSEVVLSCLFTNMTSKLNQPTYMKPIVTEAKLRFADVRFMEKVDKQKDLICFTNGVYECSTSLFREGRPSDYITLCTNTAFIPRNDIRQVDEYKDIFKSLTQFLTDILPDEETRLSTLHILHKSMCSPERVSQFVMWQGHGSNGKSKLANLIKHAFGEYVVSIPVSLFTQKRGHSNSASPEFARSRGCRIALVSEPNSNETLNMGLIKEVTGGDSMYVRNLYEKGFEFVPLFTPILLCNVLPSVTDTSHGAWRRILPVEFPTTFTENPTEPHERQLNPNIERDIVTWGRVFCAIVIHGFTVSEDFRVSDKSQHLLKGYQQESDYYVEYFAEAVSETTVPNDCVAWADLWTDFYSWFVRSHGREHLPKKSEAKRKFQSDIFKRRLHHGKWWRCVLHRTKRD